MMVKLGNLKCQRFRLLQSEVPYSNLLHTCIILLGVYSLLDNYKQIHQNNILSFAQKSELNLKMERREMLLLFNSNA